MIVWNIWRQSRLFKFQYDCTGVVKRCQASGVGRLGQQEWKFVHNNFTNTNIRNYIDKYIPSPPAPVMSLAANINYSQYQFPDKVLVSNLMNVGPRSLMSESFRSGNSELLIN